MSTELLPRDELGPQRRKFAQNMASGMPPVAAAQAAGCKNPTTDAHKFLRMPEIIAAIEAEKHKYEVVSDMTRKRVMEGLSECIDLARLQGDPMCMVSGWREIAKICGYYAPETKKIDISITNALHISQIEALSDEELAKAIIEGEAQELLEDKTEDER